MLLLELRSNRRPRRPRNMPDVAEVFVDQGRRALAAEAGDDIGYGIAVTDDQYCPLFLQHRRNHSGRVRGIILFRDQMQALG